MGLGDLSKDIFGKSTVSGVESKFQSVQDAIEKMFLPALFNESLEDEDPRISLTSLPLKFAGLSIPNVVRSAS